MNKFKQLAHKLRDFLLHPLANRMHKPDAAAQIQLKLAFKQFSNSATEFDSLSDYGFRAFSQADEDGILLFIFALIGSGRKRCVEICAADGRECNTANLIINHGWRGLLVDETRPLYARAGISMLGGVQRPSIHPFSCKRGLREITLTKSSREIISREKSTFCLSTWMVWITGYGRQSAS